MLQYSRAAPERDALSGKSLRELTLSELSSLLLELLDGTLVDSSALVDQVTGGGRLAGIDVTDDDNVNVTLCERTD